MPQIEDKRKDIKVVCYGTGVSASINCINKLDNKISLYEIELTNEDNLNWR